MTWCASSPTMFLYTNTIRTMYRGVSNVQTVDDFWKFMETDFIDGVYLEEWYNTGSSDNFLCPNYKIANGRKVSEKNCTNMTHFHFGRIIQY